MTNDYKVITHNNISRPEHVLIAERATGLRLRKGIHPVHHVNGDKSDNRNCNLVVCESKEYHHLLHARMRVLEAGGDPNTDAICGRCRLFKPLAEFHGTTRKTKRYCAPCASQRLREHRVRLGLPLGYFNALKTHCKRGHAFTPDNTYTSPNGTTRDCRVCIRLRRQPSRA